MEWGDIRRPAPFPSPNNNYLGIPVMKHTAEQTTAKNTPQASAQAQQAADKANAHEALTFAERLYLASYCAESCEKVWN